MSMSRQKHRVVTALIAGIVTASLLTLASAQSLDVAVLEDWGPVLVTDEGLTLYLYVLDADSDGFACVDACLNNWPPLIVASLDDVMVEGLDSDLVGVRERPDGTLQATYGEWPLHRSRRDLEPGHTRGQGVGNQFYMVGLDGSAVTQSIEAAEIDVSEAVFDALMAEGRTMYGRHCVACHMAEGQGGAGPRLAGMQALADTTFFLGAIIQGRTHHGMPAFGGVMTDDEIAAVATYVRNSWGNEFGAVLPEQVDPVR